MGDEDPLWRRCELAWAAWLAAEGWAVTPLADAHGNTSHSSAPLTTVGARRRRSPDLLATKQGTSHYWEVKSRSRADVDPLTGQRQHWMHFAAFQDYLQLSTQAQMKVWIVLYEAPDALSPGRWLRVDVRHLAQAGSRGERRGAGGELVPAWVWPLSEMEVVAGPVVGDESADHLLLPDEGDEVGLVASELDVVERLLRVKRPRPEKAVTGAEPGTEVEKVPAESTDGYGPTHWLDSEPALALDVLRRRLGVPHFPRYSVLKVGLSDVDVDDLLGLLHYGIRLFVVSADEPPHSMEPVELQAFKDSRLLEWSVVPEAAGCSAWGVDGSGPTNSSVDFKAAMAAADESGGLNLAQYRVVHADVDDDVMVPAGAGTGKTETMSERIVYLLATSGARATSEGDRPIDLRADEVALVTFTRESAAEMRHRIARALLLRQRLSRRCALPVLAWMLQLAAADVVTIHSLAKRIVASGGGVLGLGPEFRVARRTLDARDATYAALSDRLAALIDRYRSKVPAAHEWQRHVQMVWDALENNGVDLLGLGDDGRDVAIEWGSAPSNGLEQDVVEVTKQVVLEVARHLREQSLQDQTLPTNQLVPTATAALRAQDEAPVKRYWHVFVDEFQDTDASQMELVLELRTRLDCRLFVVGDVKQGIYRFRGAEGNAFDEMRRRVTDRGLPVMKEFPLTRNFRSGQRLLDSLHPFFARWGAAGLLPYDEADRLRPQARADDPSVTVVLEAVRSQVVADEAAARVARWRQLHPGESVGVLCRQNWQAVKVQEEVRRLEIPCELRVGGSFFQSPAVRELRVLAEAVADPRDDAGLLELCETRWAAALLQGEPPAGVPSATWGEDSAPPSRWARRFASLASDGSFLRGDLDGLRQRVGGLRLMLSSVPTIPWVIECVRSFQPEGCSLPGTDDETERQRYARCLDHLVTLLDSQFRDGPVTLERLLAWLRLQVATNRTEDEPDAETDGKVVALTVHKAKGLEFDRVAVPYTSVEFGPPKSLATRTSVLREPGQVPRLLWRWNLHAGKNYASCFSNVPLARTGDWTVDDRDTAREETRLLYVAMTRAREELAVFIDPRTHPSASPTSWAQLLEGGA